MIRIFLLTLALLGGALSSAKAQGTITPPPAGSPRPTTTQTGELQSESGDRPKMPKPATLDTNEVKLRVDPRKPIPAPARPAPKAKTKAKQ